MIPGKTLFAYCCPWQMLSMKLSSRGHHPGHLPSISHSQAQYGSFKSTVFKVKWMDSISFNSPHNGTLALHLLILNPNPHCMPTQLKVGSEIVKLNINWYSSEKVDTKQTRPACMNQDTIFTKTQYQGRAKWDFPLKIGLQPCKYWNEGEIA